MSSAPRIEPSQLVVSQAWLCPTSCLGLLRGVGTHVGMWTENEVAPCAVPRRLKVAYRGILCPRSAVHETESNDAPMRHAPQVLHPVNSWSWSRLTVSAKSCRPCHWH